MRKAKYKIDPELEIATDLEISQLLPGQQKVIKMRLGRGCEPATRKSVADLYAVPERHIEVIESKIREVFRSLRSEVRRPEAA